MPLINTMGGVKDSKLTPLISFDTIFDLDFGLINLIYTEYLDPKVFNTSFFDNKAIDNVYTIYRRSERNPLYLISDCDKSKLDIFYNDFMKEKYKDIIERSITTNVLDLISVLSSSLENKPLILYNDDIELEFIKNEPRLKSINAVKFSDLTSKDLDKFNQFFVKDILDLEKFSTMKYKSFYISSCGINFVNNGSDLYNFDLIEKLSKNGNQINIFNIYKKIKI